jgi:hypothetical protein
MVSTKATKVSLVDHRSVTGVPSMRSIKRKQLWVVTSLSLPTRGDGKSKSDRPVGAPDPDSSPHTVRCFVPDRLPCGMIPAGSSLIVVESTPLAYDARDLVLRYTGVDYSDVRVKEIDIDDQGDKKLRDMLPTGSVLIREIVKKSRFDCGNVRRDRVIVADQI